MSPFRWLKSVLRTPFLFLVPRQDPPQNFFRSLRSWPANLFIDVPLELVQKVVFEPPTERNMRTARVSHPPSKAMPGEPFQKNSGNLSGCILPVEPLLSQITKNQNPGTIFEVSILHLHPGAAGAWVAEAGRVDVKLNPVKRLA